MLNDCLGAREHNLFHTSSTYYLIWKKYDFFWILRPKIQKIFDFLLKDDI